MFKNNNAAREIFYIFIWLTGLILLYSVVYTFYLEPSKDKVSNTHGIQTSTAHKKETKPEIKKVDVVKVASKAEIKTPVPPVQTVTPTQHDTNTKKVSNDIPKVPAAAKISTDIPKVPIVAKVKTSVPTVAVTDNKIKKTKVSEVKTESKKVSDKIKVATVATVSTTTKKIEKTKVSEVKEEPKKVSAKIKVAAVATVKTSVPTVATTNKTKKTKVTNAIVLPTVPTVPTVSKVNITIPTVPTNGSSIKKTSVSNKAEVKEELHAIDTHTVEKTYNRDQELKLIEQRRERSIQRVEEARASIIKELHR